MGLTSRKIKAPPLGVVEPWAMAVEARLNFLWEAAESTLATCPAASRLYVRQLRDAAAKSGRALHPTLSQRFCDMCSSILVPGVTASARLAPLRRGAAISKSVSRKSKPRQSITLSCYACGHKTQQSGPSIGDRKKRAEDARRRARAQRSETRNKRQKLIEQIRSVQPAGSRAAGVLRLGDPSAPFSFKSAFDSSPDAQRTAKSAPRKRRRKKPRSLQARVLAGQTRGSLGKGKVAGSGDSKEGGGGGDLYSLFSSFSGV